MIKSKNAKVDEYIARASRTRPADDETDSGSNQCSRALSERKDKLRHAIL